MVLWSTGFVVARYATDDAGPLTFLAVRMILAAGILAIVAAAAGTPRRPATRPWVVLAGMGMHAMYLGGVFLAISGGMPSGVGALIAGLHPVLTALVSSASSVSASFASSGSALGSGSLV